VKEIVDKYRAKGMIFRSLKPISLKDLNSRKKISIYLGVDLGGYYTLIMHLEKKSRVLRKEAYELIELHKRVESLIESKIVKKRLTIKAPLCSKAKKLLEESGWIVD
jgi:hypothetical protein